MDVASFARPRLGEYANGDITVIEERSDHYFVAIVDVLGHGREANELAVIISSFLREQWQGSILEIIQSLHKHLDGSRGAAVGLCRLNKFGGKVRYSGVGNTVIRKFGIPLGKLPLNLNSTAYRVRYGGKLSQQRHLPIVGGEPQRLLRSAALPPL